MTRVLVVNADDLGLAPGVNRGIVEAHERGIVTSASLMVLRPAAAEAAELTRALPELAVGLHLEPGDLEAQLDAFRRLVGGDPTHVDSHKHFHLGEPSVRALGERLGVPVRHFGPARYEGGFYGRGAITVEALLRLLAGLPEGVTELGCHPGRLDGLESSYREERKTELRTLCDPRVRAAVAGAGIALRSFAEPLFGAVGPGCENDPPR